MEQEILYKVSLRQCREVEVWASNQQEAFELAMENSEWDDDYEELERREV